MKKLFIAIITFTFLFAANSLSATTNITTDLPSPEKYEATDAFKIKIVIIIIIKKKKKKGVIGEITGIRLASDADLGENEYAATAEIRDNKLFVQLDQSLKKDAKLIMPESFTLSSEVSEKLGASKSIVMSGGSTMVKETNSLLWFEIQD